MEKMRLHDGGIGDPIFAESSLDQLWRISGNEEALGELSLMELNSNGISDEYRENLFILRRILLDFRFKVSDFEEDSKLFYIEIIMDTQIFVCILL